MRDERSKEKLEQLKGLSKKDDKDYSNIMDSLTSLQSKVALMDTTTRNESFSQGQLKIIEGIIEKKLQGNNTAE